MMAEKIKFKKVLIGGYDKVDVLKKFKTINEDYQKIVEDQKKEYENKIKNQRESYESIIESLNKQYQEMFEEKLSMLLKRKRSRHKNNESNSE